jgi:hypothetical protein
LSDTDDLFKLPLAEFTAARNALAASLKDAGRTDEAAAVKALTKPPLSAWTVNQLYWHHRKPFDQLIAAGDRLRKAQTVELTQPGEGGKGEGGRGQGELRDLIQAHREALSELSKRAAALLRESGHPPAPDLTRRVTTTLEALSTFGSQEGAPQAGRLTTDVDPPGFEALSALVPQTTGKRGGATGPSRVIPFRAPEKTPARKLDPEARKKQEEQERNAKRKAAIAALREAERTLREAQKTLARQEGELRKAAARAKVTEKAKAALEKQFEQVSADADAARQDARRVASAAEEAAQAVHDAERAVDKARQDTTQ